MQTQKNSKWITIIICLIGLMVIPLDSPFLFSVNNRAFAQESAFDQEAVHSAHASPSRAPQYISVRMDKAHEILIAGETGRMEIEAHLAHPEDSGMQKFSWNGAALTP